MLMYIYTVRDAKGQLYGRPFYCHNIGHAIRGFSDQVNDPADGQNDLFKHTEDFELFELGTFDDNTALIETFPQPKPVCTGSSVKKITS
ncbi:MAG: nonstructural protein [Microvirus sp.]|nr:MAG: nonstructural protein [Microvirus sp.]